VRASCSLRGWRRGRTRVLEPIQQMSYILSNFPSAGENPSSSRTSLQREGCVQRCIQRERCVRLRATTTMVRGCSIEEIAALPLSRARALVHRAANAGPPHSGLGAGAAPSGPGCERVQAHLSAASATDSPAIGRPPTNMSSFRGFCSVQPERQSSEPGQGVLRRRLRRTPWRGCAAENLRFGLRAAVDENAPLCVVYLNRRVRLVRGEGRGVST
jgi:hypothetical protein